MTCDCDDIAADRPLRVLDVSCGSGLSAIAGARSGHNVQGFSVCGGVPRVSGMLAYQYRDIAKS